MASGTFARNIRLSVPTRALADSSSLAPLVPGLEGHEEEGGVRGRCAGQQAESVDGRDVSNPRSRRQELLDLVGDLDRALEGRGVGELHVEQQEALVLLGDEPGGQPAADQAGEEREARQDREGHRGLADQAARPVHVSVGGSGEDAVEGPEEATQRAAGLVAGPEQQRRQGRRERKSVERGDGHGDGDGDGELLVQAALDAAHQADGDEHRGEHQGDPDDGPRDLGHRLERGFPRRHPLFDVVLDGLHDHDGVVHHEADGEDQTEERERVDGETQEREEGEGADERHRHRDEGNEGGAPVLEEEEDHEDHEDHGLPKGARDLLHPLGDRAARVQPDLVVEVAREALLELRHHRLDAGRDVQGVGPRSLEHRDERGGPAVEAPRLVVGQGAQLDARHVPEAHHRALGVDAEHDRAELLGGLKPPLGAHRVGELLPRRRRLGPHAPSRVHRALLLHRPNEVGHGEAQAGQLVGLDPDAHRVLGEAEVDHLAHARHAVERVVDVDEGVVAEEEGVVAPLRGVDREHLEGQAHGAAIREAELRHVRGEVGLRLGDAVLGVDLVDVDVALHVEGHGEGHRAVVGVRGLDVERLVDAVHLLLDGRGHRLLDGHGVGARCTWSGSGSAGG